MRVSRYLCDIVHAPGKTGSDLITYLDKQWDRLGINRFECVNGVGDGGGENEGFNGLHNLLETTRGDYVRRRCFGHLPWRVADACLDAQGSDYTKVKHIMTYLRDGTTWSDRITIVK